MYKLKQMSSVCRIKTKCGPLTIQEEANIECLQHLLLQLRYFEEDDIREELKSVVGNLCIN